MFDLRAIGVAVALTVMAGAAQAAEPAKYPDWRGAWARYIPPGLGGQPSHDQTKTWGFGQQAPLTPEYRKVLEDSMADQALGGIGNFPTALCSAAGMPLMMIAFRPLEFVVTPDTTYVLIGSNDHYRRIFTDGRDFPQEIEPTYQGYSIGHWTDQDGDGVYDLLEVETRGPFKGPRAYDASGLPLHFDNQSVFFERISVDKQDKNVLHDEMTVVDHALTRPWTVDKRYVHEQNKYQDWFEFYCSEGNNQLAIGKEHYFISGDGMLMPTRRGQPGPDLRYFNPAKK